MKQIIIPKGQTESAPLALNNFQLATVFSPATTIPTVVEILGSGDGERYGPIKSSQTGLSFTTSASYYCQVFDPATFEGIMYLKFLIPKALDVDLAFDVFLKNF